MPENEQTEQAKKKAINVKELLSFRPRDAQPLPGRMPMKVDYKIDEKAIQLIYDKLVYPLLKEMFDDLEDRLDDLAILEYARLNKDHGVPAEELESIRARLESRVEVFKNKLQEDEKRWAEARKSAKSMRKPENLPMTA